MLSLSLKVQGGNYIKQKNVNLIFTIHVVKLMRAAVDKGLHQSLLHTETHRTAHIVCKVQVDFSLNTSLTLSVSKIYTHKYILCVE